MSTSETKTSPDFLSILFFLVPSNVGSYRICSPFTAREDQDLAIEHLGQQSLEGGIECGNWSAQSEGAQETAR